MPWQGCTSACQGCCGHPLRRLWPADKHTDCCGARRIGLCFLLVYVCWDLKPVFYAIWSPLTFLVGYNDPRKPSDDLLHGARPRPTALRFPALLSCSVYP